MIKIERHVTASPEQWAIIIEGMRNPMNSWNNIDSHWHTDHEGDFYFAIGSNDRALMRKLSLAGSDHAKFRRMIPVYITLTAPLYWWKEFDTYKIGTVANSCSTMHKIHEKPFVISDFSHDKLDGVSKNRVLEHTIKYLNEFREDYLKTKNRFFWYQLIQLLPSSYNQRRTVFVNYETLHNIYHARRNHKLDEWHTFCDFIETLPLSELITGEEETKA